jgi:hypothetical protein
MSAEFRTDDIVNPQQEDQDQDQDQDPALITDPDVATHIRDTLKEITSSAAVEDQDEEDEFVEFTGQSIYYDVETMAPMNAFSAVSRNIKLHLSLSLCVCVCVYVCVAVSSEGCRYFERATTRYWDVSTDNRFFLSRSTGRHSQAQSLQGPFVPSVGQAART